MDYELHLEHLKALVIEAREISGSWNGDEAGLQEDRAHAADEICDKLAEIKELIQFLQNN